MLLIERYRNVSPSAPQTLKWALAYPFLIALAYVFKPTLHEPAALWPAGACAFGAYLLLPYRTWPAIVLVTVTWELASVAVASLALGWRPSALRVLAFALANVVTAILPAAALRSARLISASERYHGARIPRSIVLLCAATLPGAVLGALVEGWVANSSATVEQVGLWSLSSVLAIVTYGPLLLDSMSTATPAPRGAAGTLERIMVPLLAAGALLAFALVPSDLKQPFVSPVLLLLIPLVWLALRFSPRDTRLGVAIIASCTLAICAHDTAALRSVAGTSDWRVAVVPMDIFLLIGCAGSLLINLLTVQQAELVAALELEHKQLRYYAEVLDSAEQSARRAVASDLHDGIGQVLVGQSMTISAMRRYAGSKPLDELITQAAEAGREAQQAIRLVIQDLSPPELENASLEHVLRYLATQFRNRHGFDVTWRVAPGVAVSPTRTRIVYRCVRELLFNAFRHSQRTRAEVDVLTSGDVLVVMVIDDGVGFDGERAKTDPRPHFGLLQLRERVHAEGGTLNVESSVGEGCCVTIRLPLEAAS
jgi:signal transduction histidine kinase